MSKKTFLMVAILLGVLVLVFSLVYAQRPRPSLMGIADELGLTDEQIESIKDVQYNFKKNQISLRADLKTSRLELRHLMMQDKPNQNEIDKLVDRIAEAQKNVLKNNIDRKLAMKGILTPEQFEKFIRMKAGRIGEWREKRMERGSRLGPGHRREFCPRRDGPGL